MNRGMLVVVSGFSGAGKGTVTRGLLDKYDCYALSVSATSRKPRPGEEEGVHYFFKSRDEFERLIKEDAFIEYASFVDNYYGTPKEYVYKKLDEGKDVILEIEVQGALQIKEKFPETVTVFMTTRSALELKNRLVGRGTETSEVIAGRLRRAVSEAELMDKYDYILINDDVSTSIEELHSLIQSQHKLASENKEFISEIKKQLKEL